MRATVMYGAHDVRVEVVPDARLLEPTDALVRVTRACIWGSDLWSYNSMAPNETGNRRGHEFVGVVEDVNSDVRTVKKGDLVVAPFAWSDGTCEFCQQGLQTSCLHGGWWGGARLDGGQGEAMRTAVSIARPGGAVGRVGVPQEQTIPNAQPIFYANVTIAGGPAPVRGYIEKLLPDVLEGRIEPGRVFDRVTDIDGVPDGYRAMNERESIKVMIQF